MKAEQLMINNLVQVNSKVYLVDQIQEATAMLCDPNFIEETVWAYYDNIEPIPLDEKWLVDFGFVIEDYGIRLVDLWKGTAGKCFGMRWIEDNNKVPFLRKDGMSINIYYVHQLQNLYHALTGTPLTIKTESK